MAQAFPGNWAGLRHMSPVEFHPGLDPRRLTEGLHCRPRNPDREGLCRELERKCDFLTIEGTGHAGVGSILKLSNARVARMLDAPVLMVTGGGIGNVSTQSI
jgi:hypothetical protein